MKLSSDDKKQIEKAGADPGSRADIKAKLRAMGKLEDKKRLTVPGEVVEPDSKVFVPDEAPAPSVGDLGLRGDVILIPGEPANLGNYNQTLEVKADVVLDPGPLATVIVVDDPDAPLFPPASERVRKLLQLLVTVRARLEESRAQLEALRREAANRAPPPPPVPRSVKVGELLEWVLATWLKLGEGVLDWITGNELGDAGDFRRRRFIELAYREAWAVEIPGPMLDELDAAKLVGHSEIFGPRIIASKNTMMKEILERPPPPSALPLDPRVSALAAQIAEVYDLVMRRSAHLQALEDEARNLALGIGDADMVNAYRELANAANNPPPAAAPAPGLLDNPIALGIAAKLLGIF